MNATKSLILSAALLVSGFTSHAITNTAIAISGTNIVLSWPSYGYESYLVQSRQTLNPTDSWTSLANAYPANSTNRTTFTLYGIVSMPNNNSSGGESPPGPNGMMTQTGSTPVEDSSGPMVIAANGTGSAVPLALYPQGFDLSGFIIFDPATGEQTSGNGYVVSPTLAAESERMADGPDDSTDADTSFFLGVSHPRLADRCFQLYV